MTAKERQRMQRLEIENRELREHQAKSMRIYSDCILEIIELRAKLELIQSAIGEPYAITTKPTA